MLLAERAHLPQQPVSDTATPLTAKRPLRPLKLAGLSAIALLLALGAASLFWWTCMQTYHFAEVTPNILYRDGLRSIRELTHAAKYSHAKTIISLVDAREQSIDPFNAEQSFADSHHVTLVRIPIPLGGWPTDADLHRFLNLMSDKSNFPILIHCAQGVRRTGMFVAAYQRTLLNLDAEQAKSAILPWGHSDRSINDIRTFIDIYNPQTQHVTQQMSNSGNID